MISSARFAVLAASLAGAAGVLAAPSLTPRSMPVGDVVSMKILQGAVDEPPPTPTVRIFTKTVGDVKTTEKVYDEDAVNYAKEVLAILRDRAGNVMRIARPDKYPWGKDVKYKFDRQFGDMRIYVDFQFAEPVSQSEAERLMRAVRSSMTTRIGAGDKNAWSMKWWGETTPEYKFVTDLSKTKGGKFIKETMRELSAMRRLYETYVPPTSRVEQCTVRVFSTMEGYRGYRSSNGSEDKTSCGLWDSAREELLVAAEDPAQARRTMRHEGFHQYLFFAMRGRHAIWFNEGHATFFENVKFNSDRSSAKVVEEGVRSAKVAKDPARYAAAFGKIVGMTQDQFYSGDASLNYCAAWALTYFLEKGVYTEERLAPYRQVLPTYMRLVSGGMDGLEATAQAFEPVKDRDLAKDFLYFWNKSACRRAALKVR